MKNRSLVSRSLDDTRNFAEDFLQTLSKQKKATVVALSGDLGSGKTAFTKELANILGVPIHEVTSPTFVIEKIYRITHPFFTHLIHIDAYRLEKESELSKLGWADISADPNNLILIEWPEMVEGLIPKDAHKITFEFVDEATRKLKIQ